MDLLRVWSLRSEEETPKSTNPIFKSDDCGFREKMRLFGTHCEMAK